MKLSIEEIIIYIVVLVASISLHEMMHSLVAYLLGDRTARDKDRLTLNPLSHIDPITTIALPLVFALSGLPPIGAARPVPVDTNNLKGEEYGLAVVGLAGPLTNLVLAAVAAGLVRLFGVPSLHIFQEFIIIWISVNISFFVFNMIPWPPLDGSRLFYAFAPEPIQRFMMQIESFGIMGIILFMIIILPMIQDFIVNVNQSILRILL